MRLQPWRLALALLALLMLLTLQGCVDDKLPAFARPPPFDAASWEAGPDVDADVDAGADDDAGQSAP